MKNLTMTRNIVVAMLMTFALALGVQVPADALDLEYGGNSGDLQRIQRIKNFTVEFSVDLSAEKFKKDAYSNYIDDPDDSDYIFDDKNGDGDRDSGETRLTKSSASYYNNESVKIRVSNTAGAKIKRVAGSLIDPASSYELKEYDGNLSSGEASDLISVVCTTTSPGKVTVTIEDTTPSEDFESGDSQGADLIITVYVVKAPGDYHGQNPTISLEGLKQGIASGYYDHDDYPIHNGGGSGHYPITYEVSPGSGEIYIQEGDREGTTEDETRGTTLITSTAAPVYLKMKETTNRVTAEIDTSDENTIGVYIYGKATLTKKTGDYTTIDYTASPPVDFATLSVNLLDSVDGGVPSVPIKFDVTDKGLSGGLLSQNITGGNTFTIVDSSNEVIDDPEPASTMYAQTTEAGLTRITYNPGTIPGDQTITVTVPGLTSLSETFTVILPTDGTTRQLFAHGTDKEEDGTYTLVALVENGGEPDAGEDVTFKTTKGLLRSTTKQAQEVTVTTDNLGKARVTYIPSESSGSWEVVASISIEDDGDITNLKEVTFNASGGSSSGTGSTISDDDDDEDIEPDTVVDRLRIVSGDDQDGETGERLDPFVVQLLDTDNEPIDRVRVDFEVRSGGGSLSVSSDVTDSDGHAQTTLTLGSNASTNSVRASVASSEIGGQSVNSVTFTATAEDAELPPDELIIDGDEDLVGEFDSPLELTVQVIDEDGDGVSGERVQFRVVEGNGRLSPANPRTDSDGYATTDFTPRSGATIEVEATSGDLSPVIFTIETGEPPDAIVKVSGDKQSSNPGSELANPFVVEVIDENDDPVSGVSVSFTVTKGGGSVSPTSATTNTNGRAQTTLTLGDTPGDNSVSARVTGLSAITFTATSGSQVLVDAANRAPLYWISRAEGTLHRLVDEDIEEVAPQVTGVTTLTVDSANGLLYFGVQTGENKGAIRRSALDGRTVQTLKTIQSVPLGIALDSAGGTLYWTNSRGKIHSMPTEGSTKIISVLESLPNPTALALSNGYLYWGEPLGRIRRMQLTGGQATLQNIATGLGDPLSIAISKGKVYWVERNAGGSGSLNRSNLDGSNIKQLKTYAGGVPLGIAVDGSDNKIYWTKGQGKIQRSNLAGKFVTDIATGLVNPGSIALGGTVVDDAPVVTKPTPTQPQTPTPTPTVASIYDINEDGSVSNADLKLVAGAVGQMGAGITNPRTDVDKNGAVDVTDLILVIANLDDDAAAPTLEVDLKAMDLDFDRVQEQVEVLLASGDTSLVAKQTLLYLQHLLASARPDETVLLANYPNPFNPETWIPYHLADNTEVRISIYDARGTLVRALTVGHQSAGYYTSRSRAAYWDGRNALGERVASGIYFYQLQTDETSPMRKMVILK